MLVEFHIRLPKERTNIMFSYLLKIAGLAVMVSMVACSGQTTITTVEAEVKGYIR